MLKYALGNRPNRRGEMEASSSRSATQGASEPTSAHRLHQTQQRGDHRSAQGRGDLQVQATAGLRSGLSSDSDRCRFACRHRLERRKPGGRRGDGCWRVGGLLLSMPVNLEMGGWENCPPVPAQGAGWGDTKPLTASRCPTIQCSSDHQQLVQTLRVRSAAPTGCPLFSRQPPAWRPPTCAADQL